MTGTMNGTWTPPAPHERRPAPKPPAPPGPGLDRSDIEAPLPGRPIWVLVGSLLVLAGLGWGAFTVVDLLAHGETVVDDRIEAAGIETINVDNSAGYVEIVGTSAEEIQIHAEISRGLRRTGYGWETVGSTLEVHGTCPIIGSQWCWVKYRIEVPQDINVVVDNDDSRVTVTNIGGSVDVNADNGRVVLSGITGSITVNSDNGRVEATGLSGPSADVSSNNGRVELTFAAAPDNVRVDSNNGSVNIALPAVDEGYNIDIETDNGSRNVDGLVDDPTSPHSVTASSNNGSITIRPTGS